MKSEGRHEIDAAKQRLEAAKALAESAGKNADLARAMMDAAKAVMASARSLIRTSTDEVEDAARRLEEAEQRWEVVDVDNERNDSPRSESHRKKRKISLSHDAGSRSYNDDGNVTALIAGTTVRQSNDINSPESSTSHASDHGRITTRETEPAVSRESVRQSNDDVGAASSGTIVDRLNNDGQATNDGTVGSEGKITSGEIIVFEGGGESEANGTYKRMRKRSYSDAPVYCKGGRWKGEAMEFVLFFRFGFWYVGVGHVNTYPTTTLYRTIDKVNCDVDWTVDVPPIWMAVNGTTSPAPKLVNGGCAVARGKTNVSHVIVEGCGLSEVNGKYPLRKHASNNGMPMYEKEGQWKGEAAKFFIFRHHACWFICADVGYARTLFYAAKCPPGNVNLPRRNGWIVVEDAFAPAPLLKW